MPTFVTKLFFLWLLILPFGYQITAYTGVIEPDKAIALILLLVGGVKLFQASDYRRNHVLIFIFLIFSLLFLKSISLLGSEYYWEFFWDDLNKVVYFIVPLLFIHDIEVFRKTGWFIVFISIVGCVSAFLVSLGLITLPISVPLEYRISWLPRAKGLFLSTGNLAQYIAFAIAMVFVAPKMKSMSMAKLLFARKVLIFSVFIGLLATQSRNVLLVLIVSAIVYWWLNKSKNMSSSMRTFFLVSVIMLVLIPLVSVSVFYYSNIVSVIAAAGGSYAETSVMSRFEQYAVAWNVISTHPLLGLDAETYQKTGTIVNHIHNMWLQLLTHGGIITLLVMFILLMRIFNGVRRLSRMKVFSEEAMIVTVYLSAMFVAVLFYIGFDKMYWTLLGVGASLVCIEAQNNVFSDTENKLSVDDKSITKFSYTGVKLRS